MRWHPIFVILFLVLKAFASAEEMDEVTHFRTFVSGLPPCDRVEVVLLGGELIIANLPEPGKPGAEAERIIGNPEWVLPDGKSDLYHDERLNQWFEITARTTIKGQDAERIAALYRSLKFRMGDASGPKDHSPRFAYRFYTGNKLLCEVSIDSGGLGVDGVLHVGLEGKRRFLGFDKKTTEELYTASFKLFPQLPRYPVSPHLGSGRRVSE